MDKTTVFLVDDHAVMRMGLASLLGTCKELQVVGDAGDGRTAIARILKLRPAVVIADLAMPGMDGLAMTHALMEKWPEAKVLILTTVSTSEELAAVLKTGAKGALLKSADLSELRKAIVTIAAGERYISDEIEQIIASDPPVPELTKRQQDILDGIVQGLSNPEIARILGISVAVVKEHSAKLFEKLGVSNRTEAVAFALSRHLLKL